MTAKKNAHDTREGWLKAATIELIDDVFSPLDRKMPEKWGVSCGFPKYGGSGAIGQCWDPVVAADGVTHMFVSPVVGDELAALNVLIHEMVHAIVGVEHGHKKPFRELAREIGLTGKMTSTVVDPDGPLPTVFEALVEKIGPYPHETMSPRAKAKPRNDWKRCMSINDDTYRVIANVKRCVEIGPPLDPWGDPMVRVDGEDWDAEV